MNALVTMFLDAHSTGFTIGIAFLVIHVLILGYLIVQVGLFPQSAGLSCSLPPGLAIWLTQSACCWCPGYTTTPGVIAMVIAAAEIAFPLWLLVKGVNMERWQDRTLALEIA